MWIKDLGGDRVCSVLSMFLVGLVFLLKSINPFLLVLCLLNDPGILIEISTI